MGVRGLFSFAKARLRAQRLHFGAGSDAVPAGAAEPSVFVVDGNSLTHFLYRSEFRLDAVLGGQFPQLFWRTREWLRALRSSGVALVALFDGPTPRAKHATRVGRVLQRLDDAKRLTRQLRDLLQLQRAVRARGLRHELLEPDVRLSVPHSSVRDFAHPTFWAHHVVREAMRAEGVPVSCMQGESDEWLAAECVRRKARGVISNDSDFLIFHTGALFVPLDSIAVGPDGSVGMKGYSASDLARALELPVELLPLFASLCGNDTVEQQLLHPFYSSYLGLRKAAWSARFDRIAEVLRRYVQLMEGNAVARCLCDVVFSPRTDRDEVWDESVRASCAKYSFAPLLEHDQPGDALVRDPLATDCDCYSPCPEAWLSVISQGAIDRAVVELQLDGAPSPVASTAHALFPRTDDVLEPLRAVVAAALSPGQGNADSADSEWSFLTAMGIDLGAQLGSLSGPHALVLVSLLAARQCDDARTFFPDGVVRALLLQYSINEAHCTSQESPFPAAKTLPPAELQCVPLLLVSSWLYSRAAMWVCALNEIDGTLPCLQPSSLLDGALFHQCYTAMRACDTPEDAWTQLQPDAATPDVASTASHLWDAFVALEEVSSPLHPPARPAVVLPPCEPVSRAPPALSPLLARVLDAEPNPALARAELDKQRHRRKRKGKRSKKGKRRR